LGIERRSGTKGEMSHTEPDKRVWSGEDEVGEDISPIAGSPIRDSQDKNKGNRLSQLKSELHQPVLSSSSADLASCVDAPATNAASMLALKKKHRRSTSLSSPLTASLFAHSLESDPPRVTTPQFSFTLGINFVGTNGLTLATADFNFSKDNTVKEVLQIAYAMKVTTTAQTPTNFLVLFLVVILFGRASILIIQL